MSLIKLLKLTQPIQRRNYRLKNWPEYNKSLIERGSINLWYCDDLEEQWYDRSVPNEPGRSLTYSDKCIYICLMVKVLYKLTYRQTEGHLKTLFERTGLKLKVPCYTQMSRRAASLRVPLKRLPKQGPIDLVIDSSGLKVFGEGEWKVRQHGVSKRRTWKKLHLGVDPLDNGIESVKLTPSNWTDDTVFHEVMDEVPHPIDRLFGDGAYGSSDCYRQSYERHCQLITPPQKNAVVQRDEKVPWLEARDQAIVRIQELEKSVGLEETRKQWKYEMDYHQRSLGETAMFRFKRLMGNSLWSLKEKAQETEVMIKSNILNTFTSLGMPDAIPALL